MLQWIKSSIWEYWQKLTSDVVSHTSFTQLRVHVPHFLARWDFRCSRNSCIFGSLLFFRPRWCNFQQRALFLTIYLAGRKINHQWAGRADRSEVSEVSQWLVCVQHDEAAFQSQTPGSSGLSSLSSLSLSYPSKWLIMSVPLVTLFVKRLVPDNSRQLVHEEEMVSKKEQDLLLFQNISLRRLSGS